MPTLISTEILMDVLQAFKKRIPAINRMGTDFRADSLKLNQTYKAHIAGLPTIATYDTSTGYKNGAVAARTLLTDVSITVDNHKHVPLKWTHLDNIKDKKSKYDQVISNAGYVLAKAVIDDILGGVTEANFSVESIYSVANSDLDALEAINADMNKKGAATEGRVGIINSDVATVLGADTRIASRDYAGQMQGGNALRRFTNVSGFGEVFEYPDMPTNALAALTSVTGTASTDVLNKVAHGLTDGTAVIITFASGFTGLTTGTRYYVRDAAADTFKVAATRGGAAIDITADGTGATVTECSLTGFFFEPRAIAILAGVPEDFNGAIASQLGIPQLMGFETVTDPETGLTLAAVSWQEVGTGDVYWSPTLVWGKAMGRQAVTATAGALTDYAGHRLLST